MQEKPSSSEKIFNLDNQANKLGMGGKLSPDSDESSYKKRMQQRKDIQAERLQIRKQKRIIDCFHRKWQGQDNCIFRYGFKDDRAWL